MATVEQKPVTTAMRRKSVRLLAAVVLAMALLLAWFWRPMNDYAATGTSYGARVVCSCRFVEGRSLRDCRKDFEPGMAMVTLSEDAKTRSVTARFPFLSSQTATFREGEGCLLEPWRN